MKQWLEAYDQLQESPLFRGLTIDEIKNLLSTRYFQKKEMTKGEYYFHQGNIPKTFYILVNGSVQVENITEEGRRKILNRFTKPGAVFGEVYAYLPDPIYDYSCIAADDTLAIEVDTHVLGPDASNQKEIRFLQYNMLHVLSEKAYFLSRKAFILSEMTLRDKITAYLRWRTERDSKMTFTREEMADYLGTTRPSLSRELKKMEADGIVTIEKDKIIFHAM